MTPAARRTVRTGVAALGLALVAAPLATAPTASASGNGLVVSEVYGGGGNSGAPLRNDFIELHNTSGAPLSLDGLSVQYRSAAGSPGGITSLHGTVPAGAHWLVAEAAGTSTAAPALPTPDDSGSIAMSGTSGQVLLATGTAAAAPGDAAVVDLVGYGAATSFEGSAPAPDLSNTTSASRAASGADTDDNAADLTAGSPDPQGSGASTPPAPEPTPATIEQVQGSGSTSPLAGTTVVTSGVVTAAYPSGGFNGFYLQTPGTGGDVDLASHDTSDAVFVFLGGGADPASYPAIGDHVQVTGPVSEYAGMTEVSPAAGGVSPLAPADAPTPAAVAYPATDASRESLEGMLLAPQGDYTVTDNYSLNQYAEIGLARGTRTLPQPTDVARPGAAADQVAADNAAKRVTLDDGSSLNYLTTGKNTPLPYLTLDHSVRVGAPAHFTRPVVLDYRNDAWKLQPRRQLTADDADQVQPATFPDTRPAAPKPVGGQLKVASFNVLNFFTETGADFVADGGSCSFYKDRAGEPVTVNSCNGDGPRGAADDGDLSRQRAKIVRAINTLGADVLSLEEIENSAKYAGPDRRDDALASLVDALNADAGSQVWDYVRSPAPADRPAVADEDVIRTAFIYKRAKATPVGASHILTGSAAFDNAREPLAQAFRPRYGAPGDTFLVIVNHFKSKGSGVDDGTGQGNSNPDRVAQAQALVRFAEQELDPRGTYRVFLTGDFNSYTQEDPMQVLYGAGYTDMGPPSAGRVRRTSSTAWSARSTTCSPTGRAIGRVTGAHVWNINSVESVAYEYSRYNYNATTSTPPTAYRSSDHDPLLVGFDASRG